MVGHDDVSVGTHEITSEAFGAFGVVDENEVEVRERGEELVGGVV